MIPTVRPPRIFTFFAVGAALIVLVGFAKSFFLMRWSGAAALPPLVHVHGAVMTMWFALFVLQARLIAHDRIALHRRVGMLGAVLALLVIVIGLCTAIEAAQLKRMPGPPLPFLAVPLFDMVVFATFVGLGLAYRKRPDIHRRMMTLASIGILGAAIFRMGLPGGLIGTIVTTVALIAACVIADAIVYRRVHRAFALGALMVALSWPLRLWLSGTPAWERFATWLIS